MGPIGSKVIEVKGQIYVLFLFVPPRSLGRSSPNLEGRWKAAPDISLRGSFFEMLMSSRSKVKFMLFLFVPLLLPGPSRRVKFTSCENNNYLQHCIINIMYLSVQWKKIVSLSDLLTF